MRESFSLILLVALAACSQSEPDRSQRGNAGTAPSASPAAVESPIASKESAVAPEVNPPGDIPDTQAFVKYRSAAGGYELEVPEGWARSEGGPSASFVDKFDGVSVTVSPSAAAPTVASARATEARRIVASGHAVTITNVSDLALPAGNAVVIRYTSNSQPNAVTNNRVRLENEAILLFHNGKQAMLTLWAPQGADNVDQWNRMSKTFRWL